MWLSQRLLQISQHSLLAPGKDGSRDFMRAYIMEMRLQDVEAKSLKDCELQEILLTAECNERVFRLENELHESNYYFREG